MSIFATWLSFILGAAAFAILLTGYGLGAALPATPRPGIGLGLSASQDLVFGSAFYGWWIAILGALFTLAALMVEGRRPFKLLLGTPALVYFLTPVCLMVVGEVIRAL
jgi:hypothetical protein